MLDALATLGGALREVYGLALERLHPPRDIPGCAPDVTSEWLTRALQRDHPGARVARVEQLNAHSGTTDRARLALTYDAPGDGPPPPSAVFIKLAPGDPKTRLFVNCMRLGATEVGFYRQVAGDAPLEVPHVFHAACGGPAQRFAILFEDLTARAARFTDVSQRITPEEARDVMRQLARLHAAFWESARFGADLAWCKGHDHNPRYRVERFVCALAVAPALRKFPELVPAELRTAGPRIIAARDRLEEAWARGPRTLIHGDCHAGNLYFLRDTVGFLDWQVVHRGQGMRDVAYFLITSLATELRRAQQRELIALYLSTLTGLGVAAPETDAAWLQYRLHALYAWIATVVTAAAASLQAEPIVRAGLARSSAAVMDLGSLAALDAL